MRKKNYAALAVALVTGGLAAKSQAGLYAQPVQNGNFDYDLTSRMPTYTYNNTIAGWYKTTGGPFAGYYSNGTQWYSQSQTSISGGVGNAYAVLQGDGTKPGGIFQSVGTFTANYNVSVSLLEAYVSGSTGHNVTVSLYSGGKASSTYTTGYGVQWGNSALSGATLLGSQTIADDGTNSFNASSFTINTGTAGTAGSTLWLEISTDATDTTALAVNNVVLTGPSVYNPLMWTGANTTTWDASTANFSNASGGVAFINGSDAIFNDVAAGKSAITLSGTLMPATITFNNSSSSYSLSGTGTIAGGASLTKLGTGSLTIATSNSFTGPVTVSAGSVILQNGAALGTSQFVNVSSGAMLALQTSSGSPTTFVNNLYLAGAGPAGQGALVNLSGTNTISGTVDVGANTATVNVSSGTLALGGSLYGTGGLIKTGAGTMNLTAYGKFFGDISVQGGTFGIYYYDSVGGTNMNVGSGATLIIPTSFALGSTNLNIYGGNVQASGGDAIGYGSNRVYNVNIVGGTFNIADSQNEGFDTNWNLTGGTMTSTGGGIYNYDVDGSAASITSNSSPTTSVISGPIKLRDDNGSGGNLIATVASGASNGIDLNISGAISGGSALTGLDKEGPGTLALTGSDSFTGGVTVNGGTLMFGDGTAGHDGFLSPTNNISLNNGANLVYNTFAAQSFAGSISSGGSANNLTKMGPGALTLTNATLSGFINVSAGKLYVASTGTISGSSVNVASGATLGGSGLVNSPVTVAPGGMIEAGQNGVGELQTNGLVFNGSGTVTIGTLTGYAFSPAIYVNGTLSTTSANSVGIAISNLTGVTTGTAYELIGYFSESGPGASSYTLSLPRGDTGTLTDTGNQIDLTLNSIGGAYNIVWTGAVSTAWDTAASNWKYNGSPTKYVNSPGDPVVFDDTAGSNQTVTLNSGNVSPASVVFNNSTYTYTLNGSNGITGNTAVTLNGTKKVTFNTPNGFTGGLTINGGILSISSDANLGAAPGTPADLVTLNAGTLQITAPITLSGSRSILVGATGGTIDVGSNAVTIPAAIDGTGNLVIASTGGGGSVSLTAVQNTDTGNLNISSGVTVNLGVAGSISTYSSQDFANIIVGSGATLNTPETHVFGYGGGFRPNIIINGGTVTDNTGVDNYLGQITFTGGTINGTGNYRLQPTTQSPAFSSVTTNPAASTATIAIPTLTFYSSGSSDQVEFNVSKGTVSTGVDLLVSSNINQAGTYPGNLIKLGAGTMVLAGTSNTYTGGTNIEAGLLVANRGLASLGAPNGVPTATVDGGEMILRNTSSASVFSLIQTGYNGGAWGSTSGITSVAAANDPTFIHAVGMLQPAAATTFEGQSLGTGDVAVKYTYYGDVNLDGKVDGSDYSVVDNAFLYNENPAHASTLLSGWQNGDFNYDGVIDGSDYTLMDNAFNMQGAQFTAQVAAQVAGSSAVPEPATLGILGMGAIGLLGRRKRR